MTYDVRSGAKNSSRTILTGIWCNRVLSFTPRSMILHAVIADRFVLREENIEVQTIGLKIIIKPFQTLYFGLESRILRIEGFSV